MCTGNPPQGGDSALEMGHDGWQHPNTIPPGGAWTLTDRESAHQARIDEEGCRISKVMNALDALPQGETTDIALLFIDLIGREITLPL